MSRTEGILGLEEVKGCSGWPGDDVVEKKRVAVLECVEDIPCNPCETVCPKGAIRVGEPITNLPRIDGEKCDGCGMCVAVCPGLAIFVVDKSGEGEEAFVTVPYEMLPLPGKGEKVECMNRSGEVVCGGTVERVVQVKKYDRTAVVTVRIGKGYADDVRSIRV